MILVTQQEDILLRLRPDTNEIINGIRHLRGVLTDVVLVLCCKAWELHHLKDVRYLMIRCVVNCQLSFSMVI
jgi:hypothetical protein